MKNNKGFTLIELLITLGLVSIVVLAVVSFFLSYVKANKTVSNTTELQYEARKIVSFMSEKFMASDGIVYISDDSDVNTNVVSDINMDINKIAAVNIKNENKDGSYEYYSFRVDDGKLFYRKTSSSNEIVDAKISGVINTNEMLSDYIKNIEISTEDGKTFNESKYLKINVNLEKDDDEYSLEQYVYLRN